MLKPTSHKYGARPCTYNGRRYDSRLEAGWAQAFDLMLRAGELKAVEPQYRVDLYFFNARGDKIRWRPWKIDFRLAQPDGTFNLVEVKGLQTPDFKMKQDIFMQVWLPDHPDHSYELIQTPARICA